MRQAEQIPDFGMETFDIGAMGADFDINVAFQEAMFGVATDKELVLEEKVRRMEVIIGESNSEVYRDFVDFRSMAAQMEMFCNHDHALNQATQGSETLNSFMSSHNDGDVHNHGESHGKHNKKDDDEIDRKTGKKKKKKRGWFGVYT
ncbi:MAG: hypothetical protein WA843_00025 [Candidatus Saccharimonadales bacterium]